MSLFLIISRMTTSISSKAFGKIALPTDRRTKYLQNRCSFMRESCTNKIGAISQLGTEKVTFPPKRGWHTDRRADICFCRVALLLKTCIYIYHIHIYKKYFCLYDNRNYRVCKRSVTWVINKIITWLQAMKFYWKYFFHYDLKMHI